MINTKYRVRDVAKDLDVKTNYVTELIEKSFGGASDAVISADSTEIFKLCERHTVSPFRWIFDIFSIGKNYADVNYMKCTLC